MSAFQYRRKLRKLQRERAKIRERSHAELQTATGEKRQQMIAEWSSEYYIVQEEIDELQSDRIREQAEQLDISLPVSATGEFWEKLHHIGDRFVLTTRGREEVREKIRKEKQQIREGWGFYLQMIITIGSLIVAALAIYFRK
jgi:hypothetical protein